MTGIPAEANTGPVEIAIRKAVREGDELATPSRSEPFWIGRISSDGIVLELGEKRTPTKFNWACLEGGYHSFTAACDSTYQWLW